MKNNEIPSCPTPWCEDEPAEVIYDGLSDEYCVECQGCQVRSPWKPDKAEALSIWCKFTRSVRPTPKREKL